MGQYFHIYNNEATIPCADAWLATQQKLGCIRCGRVELPRALNLELDPELGYLSNFASLTTRTRAVRPKSEIGGSITMIATSIVDAMGRNLVETAFYVGSISIDSKVVDSHCTLVTRDPERALWIRSESPLEVISCTLCDSQLHAFDGPAYVATSRSDAIVPVACSANFVIRSEIATKLKSLQLPELIIEPLEVRRTIDD